MAVCAMKAIVRSLCLRVSNLPGNSPPVSAPQSQGQANICSCMCVQVIVSINARTTAHDVCDLSRGCVLVYSIYYIGFAVSNSFCDSVRFGPQQENTLSDMSVDTFCQIFSIFLCTLSLTI